MSNKIRPEERLEQLESGIREVLVGMSESRQAFGSTEIKTERKRLNERLNHYEPGIAAETRIAMLLDKLWGTAIVLNAVLKQRRSRKLYAAKEQTETLLKEFVGMDAFDQQAQGGDGTRIDEEIEKLFRTMSGKSLNDIKSRFVR